jgi:hypothetical protein
MGKLKNFWVILIVITAALLLFVGLCLIGLIPMPECGHWSTASPFIKEKCSCLGISYKSPTFGGGPIMCLGICSKKVCKCSALNYAGASKDQVVQFECYNQSGARPELQQMCNIYNYYSKSKDCEECKINNTGECAQILDICQNKNRCNS